MPEDLCMVWKAYGHVTDARMDLDADVFLF